MTVPNLYWPIYKNLENECLAVANYIHFTDDQLGVYSAIIADLIVRCSIEIEALAKDLYQQLGGNMSPIDDITGTPRDPYFDTDCLDLLEQKWKLSKKQLKLTSINFYFTDIKHQIINPLHKANKRRTSGSKWKQAYQAIKHDRKNSLAKANICNLIHSMGALYILNLYYKDDRIDIGRVYLNDANFDSRAGSEIFSTFTVKATSLSMSKDMDDSNIQGFSESDLEKSIFIIKYDDKSFIEMHESHIKDLEITVQNFRNSKEIQTYFEKYPETQFKSINQACFEIGGIGLLSRIVCTKHTIQLKTHRLEAKLNKHNNIYPKVPESGLVRI